MLVLTVDVTDRPSQDIITYGSAPVSRREGSFRNVTHLKGLVWFWGKSSNLPFCPASPTPQLRVRRREWRPVGTRRSNSSILPLACPPSTPCESREEEKLSSLVSWPPSETWKTGEDSCRLVRLSPRQIKPSELFDQNYSKLRKLKCQSCIP